MNGEESAADAYLSTADALGLSPRERREGIDRLRAAADRMEGAGMRAFRLIRDNDVTGISGTGLVAEGFQLRDGRVVVNWIVPDMPSTIVIHESLTSVEMLHLHGGQTRIEWIDRG